jgi:hypothetical protein
MSVDSHIMYPYLSEFYLLVGLILPIEDEGNRKIYSALLLGSVNRLLIMSLIK